MPGPAAAHPHVFVDAGVGVVFDAEGRLHALRVVWVHDAFYTLLLLQELGMDPDLTGRLTEDEQAELARLHSNWDPGFHGDLHPQLDGMPLALSGPVGMQARLVGEGQLMLAHTRLLADPVALDGRTLRIGVYDPSYYVAYAVAAAPQVEGRDDCTARLQAPDREAAADRLRAKLDAMVAAGADPWEIELDFPAVGAEFAYEVQVTCAQSS